MTKKNTDKKVAGRTEPTNDNANESALVTLKAVADSLGITYSSRIGLEALQEKLEEYMTEQKHKDAEELRQQKKQEYAAQQQQLKSGNSDAAKRMAIIKEATKLKRIAVTCMNPNKSNWEGEIFTVSNSVIPTQKKYVPFNAKPWHVPQIIFNVLKERKCQVFKTVQRGKHKIREGYRIPEFAITELDPLTPQELEDLKKEQAMSNRLED